MKCEMCRKREASVHITTVQTSDVSNKQSKERTQQHFCHECADKLMAAAPNTNFGRGLIRLSDEYRSKLYDLLESEQPKAFYTGDDPMTQRRTSELTREFLATHLAKDNISVEGDAFMMLWMDFACSGEFYKRLEKFNRKKK